MSEPHPRVDAPSAGGRAAAPPALLLAALVAALIALLGNQGDRELTFPDELREAGTSLEMARTGDYVVPRLNGEPFLEKPPLFHAIAAAVFEVTGSRSRFAARLPAALCGALTLLATALLAGRLGGTRVAALALGCTATLGGFESGVHTAVTDNAIPPFVALAFLAVERARRPDAGLLSGAAFGLALGFAFLAKGAVGPALAVCGTLLFLAASGDLRALASGRALAAIPAAALPIALWIAALHASAGPEGVREVVRQNWSRATSGSADHAQPLWFYLERTPPYLLPWLPLVLAGLVAAVRARRRGGEGEAPSTSRQEEEPSPPGLLGVLRGWIAVVDGRAALLPACWLAAGLLLLSAASAKRSIYQLPLLPAAGILAALALDPLLFEERHWSRARRALVPLALLSALGVIGTGIAAHILAPRPGVLGVGMLGEAVGVGLLLAGALAGSRPERVAGVLLLSGALCFSNVLRAMTPASNEYRGFEEAARILEAEARAGRDVILVHAPEGIRGGMSFYLDRTLPAAASPSALPALRRALPPGRPLVVLTTLPISAIDAAIGTGEALLEEERNRRTFSIVRYPALATATAEPERPR